MSNDTKWIIGTFGPLILTVTGLLLVQISGLNTRIDDLNSRFTTLDDRLVQHLIGHPSASTEQVSQNTTLFDRSDLVQILAPDIASDPIVLQASRAQLFHDAWFFDVAFSLAARPNPSAAALNNLGVIYVNGRGVPQDDLKAVELFRQAAAQEDGDARAQNNLGVMYASGRGVPQDDLKAVELFQQAAAQEDAHAQNNLGVMYANGQGVARDYAAARKWFTRAGDQGYAEALRRRDILANRG